jgi:putative DNA primase/helicase
MSGDVRAALSERGIELRRHVPGEHRAPCPWCDRGPRDDALAVKIDADGATWHCHRCGKRGGIRQTHDGTRPEQRPKPDFQTYHVLSDWARALWETCQPIVPDCIASRYLTGRGCRIPPRSGDLRWHPALTDRASSYTGPCLIALVTEIETGEAVNLHRTWLALDGSGKAAIDKPRRLLKGHRSRGVIRLWPGGEVTLGLVVGEGIETCLAAARAGLVPVWATISAGNLAACPVLPGIEGLTILVDHDKPNPKTGKRAGHEAALELTARYVAAGFDPERDIMWIEPDGETLDVADLVAGCGR